MEQEALPNRLKKGSTFIHYHQDTEHQQLKTVILTGLVYKKKGDFRLSERGFLGRKFSLDFDPAALLDACV